MRRAGLLLTVALGAFPVPDVVAAAPAVSLSVTSIPKVKVRAPKYSAAKVDDLEITATIAPQVRGTHRLALKVFTPRGHLYQTLSVPFAGPSAPSRRRPPIVSQKVSARLPVSGTLIVTSSLYGRWRVVPTYGRVWVPEVPPTWAPYSTGQWLWDSYYGWTWVDDAPEPCGRELRFEIAR